MIVSVSVVKEAPERRQRRRSVLSMVEGERSSSVGLRMFSRKGSFVCVSGSRALRKMSALRYSEENEGSTSRFLKCCGDIALCSPSEMLHRKIPALQYYIVANPKD